MTDVMSASPEEALSRPQTANRLKTGCWPPDAACAACKSTATRYTRNTHSDSRRRIHLV